MLNTAIRLLRRCSELYWNVLPTGVAPTNASMRSGPTIVQFENTAEVMFVGSGRPLEDAARVAFKAMVGYVRAQSGMAEMDAFQFVSQHARAPIIQLVDPEYTVLVKLAKAAIPRARR